MLKEFLVKFTEQCHNLGHNNFINLDGFSNSEAVNRMVDGATGYGHRLKMGHSFHGMLESLEIDGIHGVSSWFDHMLKDFTSHDGIPLPGAMFIKDITGMDFQHSVEWLCINAADVLELGGAVGAMVLLENKFKDKPQIRNVALAVAGCVGILDDNPQLVAYSEIKVAKEINSKFKIISDEKMEHLKIAGRGFYRSIKIISVGTFFTGVAAQVFFDMDIINLVAEVSAHAVDGLLVLGEHMGLIHDAADYADSAVDVASSAGDLVNGFAPLGLGIAVSYGIKKLFHYFNREKKEAVQKLAEKAVIRRQIREAVINKLPPAYIKAYLTEGIKKDCYKPVIRKG